MITDFDRAFLNKLKAVFPNSQWADAALVYNMAYQLAEVDSNGPQQALRFPLINVFRPSGFEVNANQSFALRQRGLSYLYGTISNDFIQTRMVTVRLPYQIDVYAHSHEEVNKLCEELIMFFNFASTVEVTQVDPSSWYVTTEERDESLVWSIKNTRFFATKALADAYVADQTPDPDIRYTVEPAALIQSYEITYDSGPTEQSEFTNGDRVYHLAIVYSIYNANILDFRRTKGIGTYDIDINIQQGEEEYDIENPNI